MLRNTSFSRCLAILFPHSTHRKTEEGEKQKTYFVCFAWYYGPVFCKQQSGKVLQVFNYVQLLLLLVLTMKIFLMAEKGVWESSMERPNLSTVETFISSTEAGEFALGWWRWMDIQDLLGSPTLCWAWMKLTSIPMALGWESLPKRNVFVFLLKQPPHVGNIFCLSYCSGLRELEQNYSAGRKVSCYHLVVCREKHG